MQRPTRESPDVMDETSRPPISSHYELMARIVRRPGICCCCIWIPSEDRRRARRVFRITRRVMRAWEQERAATPLSPLAGRGPG